MSDQAHEHELVRKSTARTPDAAHDVSPDANPLTRLQRMIGNRAVQRLMTSNGGVIQTKLTVTAANDSYESEADAVADQVVQKMQAPDVQRAQEEDELMAKRDIQRAQEEDELMAKRDIQRAQEEDELMAKRDVQRAQEEDELMAKRDVQRAQEEDELMAKRDIQRAQEEDELMAKRIQRVGGADDMMGSFNVGGDFEDSLAAARGGGKAIDSGVRGKLEGAMGADFSNVRVHEGKQSDSLNQSIQAKAFTTGSDIFFRSGEYNPASSDGQKLLAHELTHTIQQGAVNTKREDGKS